MDRIDTTSEAADTVIRLAAHTLENEGPIATYDVLVQGRAEGSLTLEDFDKAVRALLNHVVSK